jgi:hypothetical protein
VVKMNIDTDTQWSYWDGLKQYEAKNREYLQGQLGNPVRFLNRWMESVLNIHRVIVHYRKAKINPTRNTMTLVCGCANPKKPWLQGTCYSFYNMIISQPEYLNLILIRVLEAFKDLNCENRCGTKAKL